MEPHDITYAESFGKFVAPIRPRSDPFEPNRWTDGFDPYDDADMPPSCVRTLLETVDAAVPVLLAIPDERTTYRSAPGKWSPREIVGHLIDSASNNHKRFVVARWRDDLVFDGYAQDDWVEAQRYQEGTWSDLVTLWAHFNRHIGRVMTSVPDEVRMRERTAHNLDRIAWRTVPADSPVTLDYFMNDYVGHLRHHLQQILGIEWDSRRDGHHG